MNDSLTLTILRKYFIAFIIDFQRKFAYMNHRFLHSQRSSVWGGLETLKKYPENFIFENEQ